MKFKFKGKSDMHFINGNKYIMITFFLVGVYYIAIFVDKRKELIEIPYSNIQNFNKNWEIDNYE